MRSELELNKAKSRTVNRWSVVKLDPEPDGVRMDSKGLVEEWYIGGYRNLTGYRNGAIAFAIRSYSIYSRETPHRRRIAIPPRNRDRGRCNRRVVCITGAETGLTGPCASFR